MRTATWVLVIVSVVCAGVIFLCYFKSYGAFGYAVHPDSGDVVVDFDYCVKSDSEYVYNQMVSNLFPKDQREVKLHELSLKDVEWLLPEEHWKIHDSVFRHWQRFGTINYILYHAKVMGLQLRTLSDVESLGGR